MKIEMTEKGQYVMSHRGNFVYYILASALIFWIFLICVLCQHAHGEMPGDKDGQTEGQTAGGQVAEEEVIVDDGKSQSCISDTDLISLGEACELTDLIVDGGEESVSREGDSLEQIQAQENARGLYGPLDGGSTVNRGHLYLINNVLVRNSDFSSSHYQCWIYANNVYAKIWGHYFSNAFDDSENMLRSMPDESLTLTVEHLKEYVSASSAGSVIRICDEMYLHSDDGWGHSQIIISHDDYGFTVFEGGLSLYPYRREAYYTYDSYVNSRWPGKYHYIKYIKYPGAPDYVDLQSTAASLEMRLNEAYDLTVAGEDLGALDQGETEGELTDYNMEEPVGDGESLSIQRDDMMDTYESEYEVDPAGDLNEPGIAINTITDLKVFVSFRGEGSIQEVK